MTSKTHPVTALLQRAHSPTTAQTIYTERIKQKPLLLRPSSPDPGTDARAKRWKARQAKESQRRKARKPKPLSAKQKRKLCIYEIPESQRRYEIYEGLHELWVEYMREILGLSAGAGEKDKAGAGKDGGRRAYVAPSGAGPMLVSADYHGALVEVVRGECVGRVGIKGIVVKDTKFTFEIITKRNELKTVPKERSIFRFEVPFAMDHDAMNKEQGQPRPCTFEIHGSQFESRPADRANKKFKQHIDPDL